MKFLWNQRLSIVQTLIESACSSTSQAMRQNKVSTLTRSTLVTPLSINVVFVLCIFSPWSLM